jgi:putative toxin-antitoxin system antitoxin component (TIGR02293 family)
MKQLNSARITRTEHQALRHGAVRFRTRGASLGLTATRTEDLVCQIERGFSFEALESFSVLSGLSVSQISSALGIPERTLARRKAARRLAPDESERLLRISTVFENAVELFEGDVAGAVTWLTSPRKALGHQTPLAYLRTEVGAREVENLIGRLEHGVFS